MSSCSLKITKQHVFFLRLFNFIYYYLSLIFAKYKSGLNLFNMSNTVQLHWQIKLNIAELVEHVAAGELILKLS